MAADKVESRGNSTYLGGGGGGEGGLWALGFGLWAPSHKRSLRKLSPIVFYCTSPLLLNPSISWLILDVLPL